MQDNFSRYGCQLSLPGFNEMIQQQLQQAKILIAGAGGLGCPAALYLTAAGIGTIGIADDDVISISNLHRQVLYNQADVGLKKAAMACTRLQEQNPAVQLINLDIRITSANVMEVIQPYDIIIDCTDNFDTKYLLNDACVLTGKPLVYGAIYQYEGQVAVFNVKNTDGIHSPNFRDLFPEVNTAQIPNCAEGGVMPTLAGIVGCIQANEVIKYIIKSSELLAGKIMMFDVQTLQSRIIKLKATGTTNITGLPVTPGVSLISAKEVKEITGVKKYELIDVRTIEEHNTFNIGGKNIPLNELEKNISLLDFKKKIILYCASGSRSAEACKQLKRMHPKANILSLEGGLNAWNEAL